MSIVPNAVQGTIVAIACYFALVWGAEGLDVLWSPTYGLGDYERSQAVLGYGRLFDLAAPGMFALAAFFAACKLAAALLFAVHIVARLRTAVVDDLDCAIFESAVLLVVLLSLAMALPAMLAHSGSLVRLHGLYLLLAAAAAALSAIEQLGAARADLARS